MATNKEDRLSSSAFNQGSDARIVGKSLQSNPYPADDPNHFSWRLGWLDCHTSYGKNAKHPVRELPKVG